MGLGFRLVSRSTQLGLSASVKALATPQIEPGVVVSDHLAWVSAAAATEFQRSGFALPTTSLCWNYVADRIQQVQEFSWKRES